MLIIFVGSLRENIWLVKPFYKIVITVLGLISGCEIPCQRLKQDKFKETPDVCMNTNGIGCTLYIPN